MIENQALFATYAYELAERIYVAYGSGTGVLFGIPSYCRRAVEEVIKIALEMASEEEEEK